MANFGNMNDSEANCAQRKLKDKKVYETLKKLRLFLGLGDKKVFFVINETKITIANLIPRIDFQLNV